MTQLKHVVEPFGEVNVLPGPAGAVQVRATILMEPQKEGAQTGIAFDGSGSMRKMYGVAGGGGKVLSPIFAPPKAVNLVAPVGQKLCSYLARKIDADGGTTCIYWSTGNNGGQVEVIGDLTAKQAEEFPFPGPKDFGTGTQLLPAVRYFVERFKDAPWGFYVFITDGELFDLEEVKSYTVRLAQEISAGRRRPLKFILIGLGTDVNEKQLEELDDLDTGTDIDLWDYKMAAEMRQLEEIFAEVVDRNARIADHGRILDPSGAVIRDYRDTGLPMLLQFIAPANAMYFTLEVNGQQIHQPLSDSVATAAGMGAAVVDEIPVVAPIEEPIAVPPVVVVPSPAGIRSASLPPAAPVTPVPVTPPPPAPAPTPVAKEDEGPKELNLDDEFIKSLDLRFEDPTRNDSDPDVGLENSKEDEDPHR